MAKVESTTCSEGYFAKRPMLVVAPLLLSHALLVTWLSIHNSANPNEPAHLAAGIYNLRYGRFEIYRVNPPLSRMIAAIPATWIFKLEADWLPSASQALGHRTEFTTGGSLFTKNDPLDVQYALAFGRLALLPLSLFGACVCYRWASDLYGCTSGRLAMAIWCFSPTVLTWAATVGPDLTSAAFGAFGFYCFWKWCREPDWTKALFAGVAGGLMLLSKGTWLVLFIAWPLIGFFYAFREPWHCCRKRTLQLASTLVVAIVVLNAGYSFIGSGRQLNSFTFVSRTLAGAAIDNGSAGGNRFESSWFGLVPVPLPEDYVIGIDLQKRDFERGMPSYLKGDWSVHGWWHYYLYALAVKMPLGTWCLVLMAFGATVLRQADSRAWRDEMVTLGPFFILVLLVSSQTGFSVHFRYVLPALPFLFVWASKAAQVFESRPFQRKQSILASLVVVACAWSISSVLFAYPHTLSYFNELAGGPRCGPKHLLGSNVDWGQDMYRLKDWYESRRDARPFGLVYSGVTPLGIYGIDIDTLPPRFDEELGGMRNVAATLEPGWYALSVNTLYGESSDFRYFLRFSPAAMAGYSTYIYRITREDVDRIRTENSLPALQYREKSQSALLSRLTDRAERKTGRPIRVAIYVGSGSSQRCVEAMKLQLQSEQFVCKELLAGDICQTTLQGIDVVVFPGGNSAEQRQAIESSGADAILSFVDSGGGYLGICAGAFLATVNKDKGIGLINSDVLSGDRLAAKIGSTTVSSLGDGMVSVQLNSYGAAVFDICHRRNDVLYSGGPIFLPGARLEMPAFTSLATFQSDLFKYDCQRGAMLGAPAVIVAPFGKGLVLAMSPHPELTPGWEYMIPRAVEVLAGTRAVQKADLQRDR